MDTLSAVVPGSRRPTTVEVKGVITSVKPVKVSPTKPCTTSPPRFKVPELSSTIRRKPSMTYRSPSSQHPAGLSIERSAVIKPSSISSSTSSNLSDSNSTSPKSQIPRIDFSPIVPPRRLYPMKPPLPLYHPLGTLARSLPKINPDAEEEEKEVAKPIPTDDSKRRSSSRTRRPAAKLRDPDAESSPIAIPAEPATDKSSSRKKRGGGQSAAAKRKRKEAEENDGTYPSKRTRTTRGGVQAAAAAAAAASEGSVSAALEGAEVVEPVEEKLPERRSTRSRVAASKPAAQRMNSSASEGTQTSASISMAVGRPQRKSRGSGRGKAKESVNEEVAAVEEDASVDALVEETATASLNGTKQDENGAGSAVQKAGSSEGELSEEGEIPSK